MKRQISRPKLSWSDIAWTLIPTLLWFGALHLRSSLIHPHCAEKPELCTKEHLLPVDRPALGLEAGRADALSFETQGLSGIWALSVPALWHLGSAVVGTATPLGALAAAGTDLVLFAQTTSINGLLTETSHLISQRPRPFVYADPVRARDFSNYTSFYSGHTSFSATATTYTVLTLAGRGAPAWVLVAAAAVSYTLVFLTGLFRVLAGRHFPTDVLAGAFAGFAVAWAVARRHRRGARSSS